MKCYEILKELNDIAPWKYAEEWDNVGLLVGSRTAEVKKVMLALEPSSEVIKQAIDTEVDMLITHHPLIFRGMKQVTGDDVIGRRVIGLIENRIIYVAMHTNADAAFMSHYAAQKMHLKKKEILESKEYGAGVAGNLPEEISAEECIALVKEVFDTEQVLFYGNQKKCVKRCAVLPGSGGDYIETALEKGADIFITGDIKYHDAIAAVEQGMMIIDAGHFQTEKIFVPIMKEKLKKSLPDLTILTASETAPYNII